MGFTKNNIKKYIPNVIIHIYFFFNAFFLPKGLAYTSILSPFLFFDIIRKKQEIKFWYFAIFLLVFDSIHLYQGVDIKSFILSNGLFVSIYFVVVSAYHFIQNNNLSKYYRQILISNSAMVVISCLFLFLPKTYQVWFWDIRKLTEGIPDFPRLKLLTYEASYYALLFTPVFFYYGLRYWHNYIKKNVIFMAIAIIVPMALSLSFGVLGAMAITVIIMLFLFSKRGWYKNKLFLLCTITIIALALTTWVYFPNNPIVVRINNIISGIDGSAKGRLFDSYRVAWDLAYQKNIFFGVGLGQVKIDIVEYVRINYHFTDPFRYDIPNSMAETLGIFGIAGVLLRLFLEVYLFFKTQVFQNQYRLTLFIFMFIYQFTGSYITNVAEYIIWVLAFSDVFEEFGVKKVIFKFKL